MNAPQPCQARPGPRSCDGAATYVCGKCFAWWYAGDPVPCGGRLADAPAGQTEKFPAVSVPRLPSAVIADLVTVAGECVANAGCAIAPPRLLAALRAEIDHLIARPCEGERVVDAAERWLLQACEHIPASSGRTRAKWTAIARTLLEEVRGDGMRALDDEARPETRSREAPR